MTDFSGFEGGETDYTADYTFVRGVYRLGTESLPYQSLAMRVDEAVTSLTLPRDVVLDPTKPIKIEELFQRDIDRGHVEDIKEYLKQPHRSKFFNAITAVILPLDPEQKGKLSHSYIDLDDRPPIVPNSALDITDVRTSPPLAAEGRRSSREDQLGQEAREGCRGGWSASTSRRYSTHE